MTALMRIEGAVMRLGGRTVLNGAGLAVAPGEVVGLVGPNGAGKSSLLRAGLGLRRLSGGTALLGGRPAAGLSDRERAAAAAYMPQERRLAWNLAAEAVAALGAPHLPDRSARRKARAALDRVGLSAMAERGVFDMSGGERARVLIARMLTAAAPLLVLDEPAAGLDPDSQLLLLDILRREALGGAGVLLTLHDLGLAARFCDRIAVICEGAVVADAPPLQALAPEVLAAVFGLHGRWTPDAVGPLLAATRVVEGDRA